MATVPAPAVQVSVFEHPRGRHLAAGSASFDRRLRGPAPRGAVHATPGLLLAETTASPRHRTRAR